MFLYEYHIEYSFRDHRLHGLDKGVTGWYAVCLACAMEWPLCRSRTMPSSDELWMQ